MKSFNIGLNAFANAKTPLTLFGNHNPEEVKQEFTPEFKAFMEKQHKEYLAKQNQGTKELA